jgi:hypothetical protein
VLAPHVERRVVEGVAGAGDLEVRGAVQVAVGVVEGGGAQRAGGTGGAGGGQGGGRERRGVVGPPGDGVRLDVVQGGVGRAAADAAQAQRGRGPAAVDLDDDEAVVVLGDLVLGVVALRGCPSGRGCRRPRRR